MIGSRVSTWIASEWLTKTGIRTAVHEMRRSGRRQDLAVLVDDLPLLLRVAVGEEDVDLGEGVEGDRMRVDLGALRLAGHVGADLALELGERVGARAGDGLVGVDDDPLEPDAVAQRHQDAAPSASSSSSGWR